MIVTQKPRSVFILPHLKAAKELRRPQGPKSQHYFMSTRMVHFKKQEQALSRGSASFLQHHNIPKQPALRGISRHRRTSSKMESTED